VFECLLSRKHAKWLGELSGFVSTDRDLAELRNAENVLTGKKKKSKPEVGSPEVFY